MAALCLVCAPHTRQTTNAMLCLLVIKSHRTPAPGERQFALEQLRLGARGARIPFVSVASASEAELAPRLTALMR